MKKKTAIDISICILMTLMCLFSFFDTKIIVSHDLTFHLNRFVGLANTFEEGQILPKIYPYANNGYGYATPLFYCDLFLYPFAILYHFGLSAVWCYKTCILFYTTLGNIFVYLIFMKETNDRKLSLFTSFLYLTCNYHLMNIFVRGALGEILAMAFVPLVLYAIYRVLIKHEDCFIFLGISFSLLVQSHLISSLLYGIFFFCMIIVFLIMNRKDFSLIKKTIITILKGTIIALLLCAWYLLPMFEQMQSQVFWLTLNGEINTIKTTTQSIKEVFTVSSNAFVPSVGIVFVVLNILYLFVKKEKYFTIIYIYTIILYLIILGIIPGIYLNVIQFYFRLYIVIFPLSIIISLYVLDNIKYKQITVILIMVFLVFSVFSINLQTMKNGEYYLYNNASIDKINSVLNFKYNLDYNHDELGGAEYLPYTEYVDYNNDSLAIKYVDQSENAVDYIYEYDRHFSQIEFTCNNERDLELLLPLSYYKGYKAYEMLDGKWKPIDTLCNQKYKEVSILSGVGEHMYRVKYVGTAIQKTTLALSSLTFISVVIYTVYKRKNKLGYNRKTGGNNYE